MKNIINALESLTPFLQTYPLWIRGIVVTWILFTAALFILLIFGKDKAQAQDANNNLPDSIQSITARGDGNIQAGRDVTINMVKPDKEAVLELIKARFDYQHGWLDVTLRNNGDNACVITKITAYILEDGRLWARKFLKPSAKYRLMIRESKVGESVSVDASQMIEPRSADRILFEFDTTQHRIIRFTLTYNDNQEMSFDHAIWDPDH